MKLIAQNGDRSVIAHRGASAYRPEHTVAAYTLAHTQGADYLETDVVLTGDGVLLCLHDLYLETTTDVAVRFPDRRRADGHFYAADLALGEAKSLQVFGRISPGEPREPMADHRLVTLKELIHLVRERNEKTGRRVGLLIETKAPAFHRQEGRPLELPLLALLEEYGYTTADSGVILQSFDADHLRRLRVEHQTRLPLMFLTSMLTTPEMVDEIVTWADGFNPSRRAIESEDGTAGIGAVEVIRHAQKKGLRVLVWTFNADEAVMRRFLYEYGVNGVITNNPDAGVASLQAKATGL